MAQKKGKGKKKGPKHIKKHKRIVMAAPPTGQAMAQSGEGFGDFVRGAYNAGKKVYDFGKRTDAFLKQSKLGTKALDIADSLAPLIPGAQAAAPALAQARAFVNQRGYGEHAMVAMRQHGGSLNPVESLGMNGSLYGQVRL